MNAAPDFTAGAVATPVADVVYIAPRESCFALTIATNQAGRISAASGSDGQIKLAGDGTATLPILCFVNDGELCTIGP